MLTDLSYHGTFDLNNNVLDMNGFDLNFISQSTLLTGTIANPNAFIGYANLYGTIDVIGDLTVEDTLQNYNSQDATLYITGNLTNNGVIRG